jgi:hypothetical protein
MPADLSKEAILTYLNDRLNVVGKLDMNERLEVALEIFVFIYTYFSHIEEKLGHRFLKSAVKAKAYEFLTTDMNGRMNVRNVCQKERLLDLSIHLINRIECLDRPQPVG